MKQGMLLRKVVQCLTHALLVLAAVTVIMSTGARESRAQSFTVLHRFCDPSNCPDGFWPHGPLIQATNGELYGTTTWGGLNQAAGTVFKMTLSGAVTTVYKFCSQADCTDGSTSLAGLIQTANGTLYGTTSMGGAANVGTIFSLGPRGLKTVYDFCSQPKCTDGASPQSPLIQADNGDFYGITNATGTNDGTVYSFAHDALTTIHDYCDMNCVANNDVPVAPLIQATNSNLYGTSYQGGTAAGAGSIFFVTPDNVYSTLYTFCNQGSASCEDGFGPEGALFQSTDGDLYGTTSEGGAYGQGSIFKISTDGTLTTLYSFCSQGLMCPDGDSPRGALIQATDGNFYGTTEGGGPALSGGTVFKLTPNGTFSTLHAFCAQRNCTDGTHPDGTLFQATNGKLYGLTSGGGRHNSGTVFMIDLGLGPFVALQTASGATGAKVNILGTSLSGTNGVTFNGMPATFTVNSTGTAIATTVPVGATSGMVVVITPGGTLKSNVAYTVK